MRKSLLHRITIIRWQ